MRVLLLDPDSPAAAIRAAEIGESPDSFGTGIRLTPDRAHLAAVIGGLPVGWLVVPCGAFLAGRMTQRKPRWLVEVSTACAIRAAGR